MLYASVAFGVQKALLAIGGNWVISLLVSGTAIVWAALYALRKAPPWLSRVLLVLLLVRFAIPVVTLGSDLLYERLLAGDYARNQQSIEGVSVVLKDSTPAVPLGVMGAPSKSSAEKAPAATAEVESASEPASSSQRNWFGRLKDQVAGAGSAAATANGTAEQPATTPEKGLFARLQDRVTSAVPVPNFEAIRASVAGLPERIIGLIVIFLLQTMIVPIFMLWALYRTAVAIARK